MPLFYKDVMSYSKAFTLDFDTFTSTILNQPLWGVRFITKRKGDKKNVLLLRNWIRSGVRYEKDVMFIDGIVDGSKTNVIYASNISMSKKHYYLMQITYC